MTNYFPKVTVLAAAGALLIPAFFAAPTQAKGLLHRHPGAAGLAAGLAAHHMAKKSAAHGGHGMMARHPKATGVVAGMAAHHMLKKH